MKISITKKGDRHQLTCTRADGSRELADLGPALPNHDLAHFVFERKLGLMHGFFGRIAQGHSVAQLSQKETIKNSPAEALIAEIGARALQSLSSGACNVDQFEELVNAELSKWSLPALTFSTDTVEGLLAEFRTLQARFRALRAGETLDLEYYSTTDGAGR